MYEIFRKQTEIWATTIANAYKIFHGNCAAKITYLLKM